MNALRTSKRTLADVAAVAALMLGTSAMADPLDDGFRDPPQSARPRVWWHWLNGNITADGIQKDIEWMSRMGIGGLQNFDVHVGTPQVVDQRIAYMTPEWQTAFHRAAALADQHKLELTIAASPGWSETGGPWVDPQDAMKKYAWSETDLIGGKRFKGKLNTPPAITGPFQNLPKQDDGLGMMRGSGKTPPNIYSDTAVVAYRVQDEAPLASFTARTADGTAIAPAALVDADITSVAKVPYGTAEQPGTILLDYARPQTVRSASMLITGAGPGLVPRLEASDNGQTWRPIAEIEVRPVPTTISFAPVTARYFRLVLTRTSLSTPDNREALPGAVTISFDPKPRRTVDVGLLRLTADTRINEFEAKAGFAMVDDYYTLERKSGGETPGIDPAAVIDLTARLGPDGQLDWTPPPGRWRVLRMGWSLIGRINHPAVEEGTGLEIDKYDAAAARRYMEHYLGMYTVATGADLIGARGLQAVLTDSTEVGPSNWTPQILAQFRRLRGYDPLPWLPTLSGVIVGSQRQSDAFLYDFRRTLSELTSSEHYGTVAKVAHEHGLKVYGEALEGGRPSLGDDMAMRQHTDIPMAAVWSFNPARGPRTVVLADMKGAASIAHLYGQNLVAAESLTSSFHPWAYGPGDLKPMIDLAFAMGVNRPVIHTSVHQPLDSKVPGFSLSFFGQYFNRLDTWAPMAKPWVDYLARTAFMLQQGRDSADIAYFYGEEAPLTGLYKSSPMSDVPRGHAYDFINAPALLDLLKVDDGDLVTESGARYRLLYLGGSSSKMTLPALQRIAALADAGATIVGEAPVASPGLQGDPARYAALVSRLWPAGSATTAVGKGRVVATRDAASALSALGIRPDFAYAGPDQNANVLFVHRKLPGGDAYYLTNREDRALNLEARFRITGRVPEIWRADTGQTEAVSYRVEDGVTVVPLPMLPHDAFFVVFRQPATAAAGTVTKPALQTVGTLSGGWDVAFQPDRGAPASIHLPTLTPLNENADAGVRYFSGTATYRTTFTSPKGVRRGAPLWLDLGKVGVVAEVSVNGKLVGTAWKAPYRLDIGSAVRPGKNQLEVRVANLWVNRLIGDAQPGAAKITFTTLPTYRADAPLPVSGLVGPVTLIAPPAK
ncbi:glycosyl hydrolase [Novosphingobium sp. BL-52-GroH]|uniref:glycosyl hydrolase n=1 Tax=Novosphingobium sp. BL-52-GroH TaxID=3349877 RepID=UPI00384F629B